MLINRTTPSLPFLINSFISVSGQSSSVTSAASNSVTSSFLFLSFLTGPSSPYIIDHKFSFFVIQWFHHSVSSCCLPVGLHDPHFLGSVHCCCSNQPSMALPENAGKPHVTALFFFFCFWCCPSSSKTGNKQKQICLPHTDLCWPSTAYSWVALLWYTRIQSNTNLLFFMCSGYILCRL